MVNNILMAVLILDLIACAVLAVRELILSILDQIDEWRGDNE